MDIYTPQQLWVYNRLSPPNPSILSNALNKRLLYFSGLILENSQVRVLARLDLPAVQTVQSTQAVQSAQTEQAVQNTAQCENKTADGTANNTNNQAVNTNNQAAKGDKPPVVILALGVNDDIESFDTSFFTSKGYAVLIVDYAGATPGKSRHTIYPKTIGGEWQTDQSQIKAAFSDPKKSCWYYWTTCILHAVTYLESCEDVDHNRICIMGMDEGGALVYKASLCSKIKAGISFFCGDILGGGEEFLPYKSCLDSRAYSNAEFPILVNATTNEHSGSFDYLSGLHDSINSARFSVFPSADRAISPAQKDNILRFFDAAIRGEVPDAPKIAVFGSGGVLYAEVITKCDKIRLYYAEECPAAFRNWKEITPPLMGENKYLSRLDVFDESKSVHVFANIEKDGFLLTTQVVTKQPVSLGANGELAFSRLIYQSDMGLEGWLAPDGDFFSFKSLSMADGPHGIDGLLGDCLITFIPGDTRFRGRNGSLLQITLCATISQDIELAVMENTASGQEFKCTKRLPLNEWTTITLNAEDFKSQKGNAHFDRVVGIKISGRGIILNSMLWV